MGAQRDAPRGSGRCGVALRSMPAVMAVLLSFPRSPNKALPPTCASRADCEVRVLATSARSTASAEGPQPVQRIAGALSTQHSL